MPEIITAQITAGIVGNIRELIRDRNYDEFPSNDLIFQKANDIYKEICRKQRCLVDDVFILLSEKDLGVHIYEEAESSINLNTVVRYDTIIPIDPDDVKYKPLKLVSQERFDKDMHNDKYAYPVIYFTDEAKRLLIWSPPDDIGWKLKIRCSRTPTAGELLSEKIDPKISEDYRPYIEFGAAWRMSLLSNKPDILKKAEVFYNEYSKIDSILPANNTYTPDWEVIEFIEED